ncbi:unnamed protein product [Spirodela intermedia]|uniref:At3g05675-like ankyrin-like domain-containing protein n=1 Tax=Spirodela intermedia TaxID=51605 RepID=A0A7I8IYH7_SPIIN|nr:unnamed protein product [Spirodela intermedia]CAA6663045.1 unnamed protein product [Spirodela intermedia]
MADLRVKRMETGQAKIRNVPIAVTPEGFWCCPSPAAFQKTMKNQSFHGNSRPSPTPPSPAPTKVSLHRTQLLPAERSPIPEAPGSNPAAATGGAPARTPKRSSENSSQRKITVGFGQPETSDLKVLLSGKEGIPVRMNVHRDVLAEHSIFFADRLSDVEIYVETVGLMYSKDVKQRLIKQSVPRVLRIMKVAEALGFQACVRACLEHLEAVPWVEEEEESVVSSVRHLHAKNLGASRILRRVSSEAATAPNETIERIIELVLRSGEDKGRREMKSLVLKLLKENSLLIGGSGGAAGDVCLGTLYDSSRSCLESLMSLFRRASEEDAAAAAAARRSSGGRSASRPTTCCGSWRSWRKRRAAEEFAGVWAGQEELAALHRRLPVASRHLVSCVTARLFVGIGRGEVVEEGIGKTILTLPLEDQQSVLLSWLGSFLKAGDGCPNLQRAFEVWWRRTFIRPFMEQHRHRHQQQGMLVEVDDRGGGGGGAETFEVLIALHPLNVELVGTGGQVGG